MREWAEEGLGRRNATDIRYEKGNDIGIQDIGVLETVKYPLENDNF